MPTHGLAEPLGVVVQRGDIVASLDGNGIAVVPRGLDHTEQAYARPVPMTGKRLNLVGGPIAPCFVPPVVLVLRSPIIYGGIGVELSIGAVLKVLEMGVKFGLIVLDGQHVVSLLFDDLLGGAGMTPQRIGSDDTAFEV